MGRFGEGCGRVCRDDRVPPSLLVKAYLGYLYLLVLAGALLVFAMKAEGITAATVFFAFLVALHVLSLALFLRATARRVWIDGTGISAVAYAGRRTSIRWRDVGVVEDFWTPAFAWSNRRIRLRSRTSHADIVFTELISGLDELLEAVKRNVPPDVAYESPKWWKRLRITG